MLPHLIAALLTLTTSATPSSRPAITVNAKQDLALVPRRLFGTGLRANMQNTDEVRAFLRQTGITLFRYPDSIDLGYTWDWTADGVMVRKGKPLISSLARVPNVAALAAGLKAELFFTTKIIDSSPEEAARTVAEMKKRGFGGAYWCLGNEPWLKNTPGSVAKEAYVELVNRFAPAMKQADPQIHIGISWGGPYVEEESDKGRDSFVLRGTKQWVDFIDYHFYTGRFEKETGPDARRVLAGALLVEPQMKKFREIIQREAPEKADRIEMMYWEWSGPCWPTVGGLQTLATGVFAADALGEMARCGVKAAMQYTLQEHACGLIPGFEQDAEDTWKTEPWNGRTVRPIAHAIQLWTREMGPTLVASSVRGAASYQTKDWHTLINYQGAVPYLAAHATRSADGKALQLMVVNRHETEAIDADIALDGFTPAPDAEVILLNGPTANSTNDVTNRQPPYHSYLDAPGPVVKLTRSRLPGVSAAFRRAFPAHSVTVIRMTPSTKRDS